MGTHPIFESDFDCLTEKNGSDSSNRNFSRFCGDLSFILLFDNSVLGDKCFEQQRNSNNKSKSARTLEILRETAKCWKLSMSIAESIWNRATCSIRNCWFSRPRHYWLHRRNWRFYCRSRFI